MAFVGTAGAFLRLLLKGSLLQIPTFGFYRFWLVTDIRQHLWANTRLDGEAFEYTGTPRELLTGFLVALAVLAPFYMLDFILGVAAERLQAFASVPFLLMLYAFGHYAIFRARRYRATRTVFRGLRFWMTGSGWRYAGRAFLWDMATVLTLGLAYPWRAAALERYKMRNTRYGSLSGDFVGTGGALFRRGWGLWILALVLVLAAVGLGVSAVVNREGPARFVAAFGLALLVLPIVYPLLKAIEIRWRVEGLRFGKIALESNLSRAAVIACYLRLLLAWVGFALLAGSVIVVLAYSTGLRPAALEEGGAAGLQSLPAIFAMMFVVLATLLGLGLLKRYFIDRGLWAVVVGSVAVLNLSALEEVVAMGEASGSLGEGLADALDIGGI
jgi:uncharacterized membrane protein YjgN (DUF898 family)